VALAAGLLLSGCREETQAQPATAAPAAQQPAPPVLRPAASGPAIDPALDDPQKPPWLPHPRDITGWVRSSNVRVVAIQNQFNGHGDPGSGTPDSGPDPTSDAGTVHSRPAALNHPHLVRVAPAFSGVRAARCEFDSVAPCPPGLHAEVILLEAGSSDDAYGLFTALLVQPPDQAVASLSSAVEEDGRYERFCWQGRYTIHVRTQSATTEQARSCIDRLAAGMAEPVPSDPPPLVLSYFPRDQRLPGQELFVRRDLGVLPASVRQLIPGGRHEDTGRLLGLSEGTSCAIVGYDAGPGESPNFVWLVQYPDEQQAADAAARYRSALASMHPPPDVLLEGPLGRFVVGTWTRGQESLPNMHIIQRIAEKLPK
jgi:hypothetical protein